MSKSSLLLKKIIKNKNAYLLLSPNLILLFVFLIGPFIWVLMLSFQEGAILEPKTYVGLTNYIKIVTNQQMMKSILNTFIYTFTVIPLVFVLGMFIAFLLNYIPRFQHFFRALLFIPLLSSIVVAAIIWRYLVYPDYGPLSRLLGFFGLTSPNWFGNPKVVLFTIVMVELWRGLPFYIVTFFAGIQSTPKEMIEASYIDGASYLQIVFRIIIPYLKPIITFCLVMATIWALQLFDSVYVLTRGGPFRASSTIVWSIYENIFFFNRTGLGSAMSVILIIFIGIMTVLNLRVMKFQQDN